MLDPFVSIVVPTFNRASLLGDCLESLLDQDYPADRFEIVVVDDGSTEPVAEVVASIVTRNKPPRVKYSRQEHSGLNVARNRGIHETAGDPICFVDDDALAPPGWLREIVGATRRHPDAGCIGGPARPRFEGRPPRMCAGESIIGAGFEVGDEEHRRESVYGMNLSVRRWAIDQVGHFDEQLPLYGEEEEWQFRLREAGSYSMYVPAAWLEHRRTADDLALRNLIRSAFRRGRAFPPVAIYHRRHLSVVGEWRRVPMALAHALVRRCWGGVFRACYSWSSGAEVLRRCLRGPRSPFLNVVPRREEWDRRWRRLKAGGRDQ